ncbi:MAG TPA: hypothetical protein VFH38_10385 [Jatrophihabitans sp.]|nr:hypothetical protein [Jatrophihabitans sp.]
MGAVQDLDDESLVAELVEAGRAHGELTARFVNDYGNANLPSDDPRHPDNWADERRAELRRDRDALLALGERFAALTRELCDRRLG